MALTRPEKEQIVSELSERLNRQQSVVLMNIEGMSIAQQEELRSRLRETGVEMLVARKTLIDLALRDIGVDLSVSDIKKPLALVLGYDDVVMPAKIVRGFVKEFEVGEMFGGLIGSDVVTVEQVQELAQLPGRDELRAKVVGSLAAPMQGFVGVLQGTIRSFLSVLQQRSAQE